MCLICLACAKHGLDGKVDEPSILRTRDVPGPQAFPLIQLAGGEVLPNEIRFLRKCRWQRDDRAHAAEGRGNRPRRQFARVPVDHQGAADRL